MINGARADILSYKQHLNFRLKIAQARICILEGASVDLVRLQNNYREEIDELRKTEKQNPDLALAHAKIKELEGSVL